MAPQGIRGLLIVPHQARSLGVWGSEVGCRGHQEGRAGTSATGHRGLDVYPWLLDFRQSWDICSVFHLLIPAVISCWERAEPFSKLAEPSSEFHEENKEFPKSDTAFPQGTSRQGGAGGRHVQAQ